MKKKGFKYLIILLLIGIFYVNFAAGQFDEVTTTEEKGTTTEEKQKEEELPLKEEEKDGGDEKDGEEDEDSNSTTTLNPIWDTRITENAANTNYDTDHFLLLIKYTNYNHRAFLNFDISILPAGSVIENATLSLYYYQEDANDPTGEQVDVWKITRNDWEKEQTTWNEYKTSESWSAAGGDFNSTLGGTTTIPASFGWVDWNITNLVEDAYDNDLDVNLILKFKTEDTNDMEPRFYSVEETDYEPKLIIEYSVSELPTSTIPDVFSSWFEESGIYILWTLAFLFAIILIKPIISIIKIIIYYRKDKYL